MADCASASSSVWPGAEAFRRNVTAATGSELATSIVPRKLLTSGNRSPATGRDKCPPAASVAIVVSTIVPLISNKVNVRAEAVAFGLNSTTLVCVPRVESTGITYAAPTIELPVPDSLNRFALASYAETMVETPIGTLAETGAAPAEPSPLPSVWRIRVPFGLRATENGLPLPRSGKFTVRGLPSSRVNATFTVALDVLALVNTIVLRRLPAAVAPSIT